MCVCNCTCIHLITELWFTWRLSWSYCFATSAWDNWHQRLLQCSPQELEIICREPLFLQQFPNLGQSKHYRTAASTTTTVLMSQIMIGILVIFSHDRSAYTCKLCGGRSDRGRPRSSHGRHSYIGPSSLLYVLTGCLLTYCWENLKVCWNNSPKTDLQD